MEEIWRAVVQYPNYAVSNLGGVKRLTSRNNARAGAVLAQFLVCGYRAVNLLNEQGRKSVRVHRLVAEAFLDRPDGATEVNHIDSNRGNSVVTNLEWVTSSGNRLHAYRSGGLSASGESNGYSKLTDERVREIRRLSPSTRAARLDVAAQFGVSPATVHDVLRRRTWAHVV